jgi:hypothetical protein
MKQSFLILIYSISLFANSISPTVTDYQFKEIIIFENNSTSNYEILLNEKKYTLEMGTSRGIHCQKEKFVLIDISNLSNNTTNQYSFSCGKIITIKEGK